MDCLDLSSKILIWVNTLSTLPETESEAAGPSQDHTVSEDVSKPWV